MAQAREVKVSPHGKPMILQLDIAGNPCRWINYERAVYYYSKELVAWTVGDNGYRIMGGTSRAGTQSFMDLNTIIAIRGKMGDKFIHRDPTLTNRALFRRDMNLCAYCGTVYKQNDLTRDHVMPVSRNGKDVWTNVVSSCGGCNRQKDDMTPEEAGMRLLYVPYAPSRAEWLILMNRNILANQMEFLLARASQSSHLRDSQFMDRFNDPNAAIDQDDDPDADVD